MADVSVRPARGADAGRMAELQVAVWREQYADLLPIGALDGLSVEAAREGWERAAAAPPSPRHQVLVALEGHRLVGLAAVAPAEDPDLDTAATGELLLLLVDPSATRGGHGSRLLAAAMQHLRDTRSTAAVSWVLEADAVTTRFLEGAGWALDGAKRGLEVTESADGGGAVAQVRLHTDLTTAD